MSKHNRLCEYDGWMCDCLDIAVAAARADERDKAAADAETAVEVLVRGHECRKDCGCLSCEAADDIVFAVRNGWAVYIETQRLSDEAFRVAAIREKGESNG
jgi:hypothetical protein